MGQIIKGKIYLEYMYVANIFMEKKPSKNLSEEKKFWGERTNCIPSPIEH